MQCTARLKRKARGKDHRSHPGKAKTTSTVLGDSQIYVYINIIYILYIYILYLFYHIHIYIYICLFIYYIILYRIRFFYVFISIQKSLQMMVPVSVATSPGQVAHVQNKCRLRVRRQPSWRKEPSKILRVIISSQYYNNYR